MTNTRSNKYDTFKQETARELGINYTANSYNGDMTTKQAGHLGGNMVKKMVEAQKQVLS